MRVQSVTLKLNGMRKAQDFVVYKRDSEDQPYKIQSDTYIAMVHSVNGKTILAGPHSSGAYSRHLGEGMPKRKAVQLTPEELQLVKDAEARPGQTLGCDAVTIA